MPPASSEYRLVGFSPDLDWRPVTFLKPLPAYRVCCACGLVRKSAVLLPCMHTLCERCYDQGNSYVCPLDGTEYEMRDVDIKDFPDEDLLSREVKCWNEASGCQHTMAASGIAQHFLRECEHHSICCPKCSATVLCTDVYSHLQSEFCNTPTPLASESQVALRQLDGRALLTSFNGAFDRQAEEISTHLRPIAVGIGAHGDKLDEISHGINTLKEALRDELEALTDHINESLTETSAETVGSNEGLQERFATFNETVDTLSRNITGLEEALKDELRLTRDSLTEIKGSVEQVSAKVTENSPKALECFTSVLRHSELQATHCVVSIKDVQSLQESVKEKSTACDGDQMYLRGYIITPGVWLSKSGDSVIMQGRYVLHKGDLDEFVPWPFKHTIRLSVVHPKEGEERSVECKPKGWARANQKPTASSNDSYICIYDDHLTLQTLISDGYIENDELQVKWKLLP